MTLYSSACMLILVWCLCADYSLAASNNIVFDLADLTTDLETDFGWVTLEAFKSSLNDLIIEKKDPQAYGQLNWLSIGYPKLVLNPATKNQSGLFNFKPEGFDARVDMLTNQHRTIFQSLVKRKYNIDVKLDQIVSLIPSRFECQLVFYSDNADKVLINGKVNQLNTFPLKLEFSAPAKSKERILFEKRQAADGAKLDLEFQCEVSSQGQAYRQNTLVITGNQMNQLGLVDEVFGPADSTFVTRKQTSDLSSELYFKLNIIEEYQMAESEFTASFVDDFIKQTATFILQYVPIDTALAQISQYDFRADVQPNVIKSELSKILVVNKTNGVDRLVLDQKYYEALKESSHIDSAASAEGDFIDLFSASASASYVNDKSRDWSMSNTSFYDQLKELNSYYKNDIEWQRVGDTIVPKSLKISKLERALFSKNLVFSRVKREFYDAPFKRDFSLYTISTLYSAAQVLENTARLQKLESDSTATNKSISKLNTKMVEVSTTLDTLNRTKASVDSMAQVAGFHVGDFKWCDRNADHGGWLVRDGRLLSRVQFAKLFAVIGTRYGAGDGVSTFSIGDARGRVIVGAGQSPGLSDRPLGQYGGEEAHRLTEAEMPSHQHLIAGVDNSAVPFYPGNSLYGRSNEVANVDNYPSTYSRASSRSGGDGPHNNMQPFLVLNSFVYAGN